MKKEFEFGGKKHTAVLQKSDNSYYIECDELHAYTQGKTVDEALANLCEVCELLKEVKNESCNIHQSIN